MAKTLHLRTTITDEATKTRLQTLLKTRFHDVHGATAIVLRVALTEYLEREVADASGNGAVLAAVPDAVEGDF